MDDSKVTIATSVALPVQDVVLRHLKDLEGNPVTVRCEAVDEVVMAEVFGLPGIVDATGLKDDMERTVRYLIETGPRLIHAATALRGEGGAWVRPAFHADDAHTVPGSVPWRMLRFEDKALVVDAILVCSGYGGAAGPSFPVRLRTGSGNGRRAVAARQGVRKKSPRGAPRS